MRKIIKVVAYYRLSKKRKDKVTGELIETGLGIAAQKKIVAEFVAQHGARVIAEYTEIETATGKRDRPKLATAISQVRLTKSTLVIARIDRLTRNVHFVTMLQEAKVDFVACDMPQANHTMIQMMVVMAQHEAEMAGTRTHQALDELIGTGARLGSRRPGHWDGREHDRLRGAIEGAKTAARLRTERAIEAYKEVMPEIRERREKGEPFHAIAEALNKHGWTTSRGFEFTAGSVFRIYDLYDREGVKS